MLERIFEVDQIKDHKKNLKTNYKGLHQMVHVKDEVLERRQLDRNLFPEVEVQYWNKEVEKDCVNGMLSYSHYKKSEFLRVMDEIKYDRADFLNNLPQYFEVVGGILHTYSAEETLYKMYPEIKIAEQEKKEEEVEVR